MYDTALTGAAIIVNRSKNEFKTHEQKNGDLIRAMLRVSSENFGTRRIRPVIVTPRNSQLIFGNVFLSFSGLFSPPTPCVILFSNTLFHSLALSFHFHLASSPSLTFSIFPPLTVFTSHDFFLLARISTSQPLCRQNFSLPKRI